MYKAKRPFYAHGQRFAVGDAVPEGIAKEYPHLVIQETVQGPESFQGYSNTQLSRAKVEAKKGKPQKVILKDGKTKLIRK